MPALIATLAGAQEIPGGWAAACPLCGSELGLYQTIHGWLALCDGYCTSAEVLDHLRSELIPRHRHATRMWIALRLALTPDAWAGLILGLPVQPAAIDQDELQRLRKAGLWQ